MMTPALEKVAELLQPQLEQLRSLSPADRKPLIQLAVMDSKTDLNPDDPAVIRRIEKYALGIAARPVLPRIEKLTGLKHGQIAELIGKARPTAQAYLSGRLPENLDIEARETLARVVEERFAEMNAEISSLLDDLRVKVD